MPELPDVESFKKYFRATSLHKKIVEVESSAKNLIKKITFRDFKNKLIGRSFQRAHRRGKFLIVEIKGIPEKLIFHFAMTGNLHYVKQGAEKRGKDRFTRLCFKFSNGYELRWQNMRKLGKIYLVKDPEEIELIKEMGPEPLSLSEKEFFRLLEQHQDKNVKAWLMAQRDIAGIGNEYSDEMLFQSKINPQRKIEKLTQKEKKILYQKMRYVLTRATQIMSSERKFPRSWLEPHRHTDQICPRNKKHKLNRKTIAGRSAIFCPVCQK